MYEGFIIFSFVLVNYIFISFLTIPNTPNFNFVGTCGEFLFKIGYKFILHVLFEVLLHATMWPKIALGLKGRVLIYLF
jgi:hypothetical protein